jgi:hypothetical protein
MKTILKKLNGLNNLFVKTNDITLDNGKKLLVVSIRGTDFAMDRAKSHLDNERINYNSNHYFGPLVISFHLEK